MTHLEHRDDLVVVAVGVVLSAIALYLLLTRRTWFGQHLPLPLHPASPRPGTVPGMARGLRMRRR
jgi:hypothetical protein